VRGGVAPPILNGARPSRHCSAGSGAGCGPVIVMHARDAYTLQVLRVRYYEGIRAGCAGLEWGYEWNAAHGRARLRRCRGRKDYLNFDVYEKDLRGMINIGSIIT
jgi:hypothetical protein